MVRNYQTSFVAHLTHSLVKILGSLFFSLDKIARDVVKQWSYKTLNSTKYLQNIAMNNKAEEMMMMKVELAVQDLNSAN